MSTPIAIRGKSSKRLARSSESPPVLSFPSRSISPSFTTRTSPTHPKPSKTASIESFNSHHNHNRANSTSSSSSSSSNNNLHHYLRTGFQTSPTIVTEGASGSGGGGGGGGGGEPVLNRSGSSPTIGSAPSLGGSVGHRRVPSASSGLVSATSPNRNKSPRSPRGREDDVPRLNFSELTGGDTSKTINKPLYAGLRPSILSSEASKNSYRGLINLGLLVLLVSNIRMIVENFAKYGVLIRFSLVTADDFLRWPSVETFVVLLACTLVGYGTERLLSRPSRHARLFVLLQWLNILLVVLFPMAIIYLHAPEPVSALTVVMFAVVLQLKLISYALVNRKARNYFFKRTRVAQPIELQPISSAGSDPTESPPPVLSREPSFEREPSLTSSNSLPAAAGKPLSHRRRKDFITCGPVQYPDNVTLGDLFYFTLAPTLCYELNFARSESIRWYFLLRRVCEFIFLFLIQVIILEQYLRPAVLNSMHPLENNNFVLVAERIMKLSVPNLCFWLTGFYMFFHVLLNIFGEITRFGDRHFYDDWWNSTDLVEFWRSWNKPVHNWLLRHVYWPSISQGFSKTSAGLVVFFISAVYHEILVSCAFHTVKIWAFASMMFQVPFAFVTKRFFTGTAYGNVFFWVTILLGQPFAVLMYFQDYYARSQDNLDFIRLYGGK